MKNLLSLLIVAVLASFTLPAKDAAADSGVIPSETIESSAAARENLLQYLELQQRYRRQWSGAVANYTLALISLPWGLGDLFGRPCYEIINHTVESKFRCLDEDTGVHSIEREALRGAKITLGAIALGLGVGMPLHRSANSHRRAARAMLANDDLAASWDYRLHRANNQLRTGRNFLVASGVATAASVSLLVSMPLTDVDEKRDKRARSAMFTGVSALSAATVGSALFIHGRRLASASDDTPAQVLLLPAFYDDGAGLSLWMGF